MLAYLPSIHRALGSVPFTRKGKGEKVKEKFCIPGQ